MSLIYAITWNVDGELAAFLLRRSTTTASKWCISRFSEWASPGAPPIMPDYQIDHMYIYSDAEVMGAIL
jgi:hypothetical protein